jgi:hypothetical protein
MLMEKWLDAGLPGESIDDRTARIIRDWEDEGFRHYVTTIDSWGHRQMQFRKYVPDRRDGLDVRPGAFAAFLNEMAEQNTKIVCPKCGKVHDFNGTDVLTRQDQDC